jgi:hypothetical protein
MIIMGYVHDIILMLISVQFEVRAMNYTKIKILKPILSVVCFAIIMGMVQQPKISSYPVPGIMIGARPVSASEQYGILGHMAPELSLNTWIDGDGKEIEPIYLKDYRGKVVYLYFFQNW